MARTDRGQRGLDTSLSGPPIGGIVRQKDKPWIALGISRATWYRHGKPAEWRRLSTNKDEAAAGGMSLRTYDRLMQVFGPRGSDHLLRDYVRHGGMTLAMADYLLAHPKELRRFRAWARKKAKSQDLA